MSVRERTELAVCYECRRCDVRKFVPRLSFREAERTPW